MNEHEELTKEERELEMICKEIEWNSKRIMSDRSRKRIKGLYYNKGLPIQSLRTLDKQTDMLARGVLRPNAFHPSGISAGTLHHPNTLQPSWRIFFHFFREQISILIP